MSDIVLEGVTVGYGGEVAVRDVDLEVQSGELFVLVGPSGCGKTTLLRVIAGLEQPSAGEVYVDGERVTDRPARKRDVSFVFQDYALFPHMDVRENLSFNLRMRDAGGDLDRRVEAVADRLGIDGLLDRHVEELSGGQKQRVALGRAIVSEPLAFLLDEPFANLDANLREGMREEVVRLHRDLDTTTIHVTHDQREALSMGDRVAVLRDGELQQVGTPEAVYDRPRTRFVAQFVGTPAMNLLPGSLDPERGRLHVDLDRGGPISLPVETDESAARAVEVGVRPEHVEVGPRVSGDGGPAAATVDRVEFQGADRFAYLEFGGRRVVARLPVESDVRSGERVGIDLGGGPLHAFDAETGARLSVESGDAGPADATEPRLDDPVEEP